MAIDSADVSGVADVLRDTLSVGGVSGPPLADGEYDAIVLGTGLTECMLSGILSTAGLRVLHCDRNNYYGGSCASLNMKQMLEQFKQTNVLARQAPADSHLGSLREYNIDLIPKFIMAGGNMVRMLVHTQVTKYLEFKLVDGSFVYTDGRPHKVPATPREAMTSGLMGLLEKNRCRGFFSYVHSYEPSDRSTHDSLDLTTMTMAELYKYYSLQPATIGFVGHALALYRDDSYMARPAIETVLRIQLYATSLARHGKSPYLYPLYGLGELPQAFARLSAVHGGTYMLQTPVDQVLYDDEGRACGVRSGNCVAKCKFIAGDPSYFPERVVHKGKVVRRYCILTAPPENTRESSSCQIIIPAAQVTPPRKNDIYVLVLSSNHKTTPEGYYLALVSTTVETNDPESELAAGVGLLGPIVESFLVVEDLFEPKADGRVDQVFVSRSYDATTHFETTVDDVFDLYKRIFGNDLVLTSGPDAGGSGSQA
jgi:Rab GDP dissociation inhibitor